MFYSREHVAEHVVVLSLQVGFLLDLFYLYLLFRPANGWELGVDHHELRQQNLAINF